MQQQHFCRRTAWPSPQKPRVANACAVEHNEISRSDEPSQVTEAPVFDLLVLSSDYQQPASSSLGDGILCDEVWWEVVLEVGGGVGHVAGRAVMGSGWWVVGVKSEAYERIPPPPITHNPPPALFLL